jgi:hypothetical protein
MVPQDVMSSYLDGKDVIFYNVELTGHRVGWHHRESRDGHGILWVVALCYDPNNGLLHYVHASTEDRKGDAQYTSEIILKDLAAGGVLTNEQVRGINHRLGTPLKGGVPR